MPRLRVVIPAFLTFLLPFAAAAETISGVVRDATAGTPLPQMTVAAYVGDGSSATTTTDNTGHYRLELNPGTYRVLAYDDLGKYATEFNADAPSFEESPATVLTPGQSVTVDLNMHVGGNVAGNVTTSGGDIGGLTVAAYNLSGTRRGFTKTDSGGSYNIVLPPGQYKMVAYDDAGAFAPSFYNQSQTFANATPVTVTAQTTAGNISFFLQLGARLLGVVTNANNAAIANAVVLAYNAAGTQITFAITAPNGVFAMTVPPGTYRFVAVDPSFTYAAGFLSGADSFETSPALSLSGGQARTDLVFRLDRGGTVTGSVIDAATGAVLRNIDVAAYNSDGTERTFVTTDANGKYVLLLPPGDFRIAAFDTALEYAAQFYPQSTSFARGDAITASPGQTVSLQPFTLLHGGHFRGTVIDQSNGAAIGGAVVAAYDLSGYLITSGTTSQKDGTYRVVVPPGSYRLIAYDPQLRYAPTYAGGVVTFAAIKPVTVTIDAEQSLSFSMLHGTLLTGSVVDRAHVPVPDIEITALDLQANAVATAISGTDGTFRLSLVPGKYKFMAVDPNGRYAVSYMGGTSFATAATVVVDATGAPPLIVTVSAPSKRRAVLH